MIDIGTINTGVRLEAKAAIRSLNAIDKAINRINNSINGMNNRNKQVTVVVNNIGRQVNNVSRATRNARRQTDGLAQGFTGADRAARGLLRTVRSIAGGYLALQAAAQAMSTSDVITSAENKFGAMGYSGSQSEEVMGKIYNASQDARTGFSSMISNVGKAFTLAPDAFQGNIDNAIKFQEIMAKTYTLGGASAAEQSTSMYQLIQGLGSGILQGDELRSVREGAPLAYKAIEEFAQGIYGAEENLKDLGSQGKITSDIVVAAIMGTMNEVDAKFKETSMTFAQFWSVFKNDATMAFKPFLQTINEILNSDGFQAFASTAISALYAVGSVLNWVAQGVQFVIDNWKWFAIVILPLVAAALGTVVFLLFKVATTAIIAGVKMVVMWLSSLGVVGWVVMGIIAVIAALNALGVSTEQIVSWIVGVIYAAASVVWNTFIALIVAINGQVVFLASIFDAFANFFGNLLNDPAGAVINTVAKMADTVLGILQNIAGAIDAIFGSGISDAIGNFRVTVSGKADELTAKYGNGTYEEKSDMAGDLNKMIGNIVDNSTWNTSDAWSMGNRHGSAAYNWTSEKLGGMFGGLAGLGGAGSQFATPNFDIGDALANLDDIAGNTGDTAKNTSLQEDDLKFMRQLAEKEWKQVFTTREVSVNLGGVNNVVNEKSDLDGIVTYLSDALKQDLEMSALGVHS